MTIVYAGGELMTGDEIAEALLTYSQALAQSDTASTVEIPTLDDDGERLNVKVLVGPASQIMAKPTESEFGELRDPDVVAHLASMTARLQPVRNIVSPASDKLPDWVEEL
jgi:hypothetical protein